jgi:hypothetical protein
VRQFQLAHSPLNNLTSQTTALVSESWPAGEAEASAAGEQLAKE